MDKNDIECYRTNYNKKSWLKINNFGSNFMFLPVGILDAVEALCEEVERLRGWR